MKTSASLLLGVAITLFLATPAMAQTFTTDTFTDATVLSKAGLSANEVAGVNFVGSTVTINGYTLTNGGTGGTGDPIDLSGYAAGYSGFLGGGGNGVLTTTGNADFDTVVGTGAYNTNTGTITINDLTAGTYRVLVLSDDDRTENSGATDVSLEDNNMNSTSIAGGYEGGTGHPSASNSSKNQFEGAYLTDTFTVTAGQTSHALTFNGSYVNAILVASVPAVPEPSTYALMGLGLGLGLLALTLRRRSAQS